MNYCMNPVQRKTDFNLETEGVCNISTAAEPVR
jgi:hypothetical protein